MLGAHMLENTISNMTHVLYTCKIYCYIVECDVTVILEYSSTVMVDQYEEFSVELHDEWVMRGSAAVFECKVNPVFVKDYVRVVGWSIGSKDIVPGKRYFTIN